MVDDLFVTNDVSGFYNPTIGFLLPIASKISADITQLQKFFLSSQSKLRCPTRYDLTSKPGNHETLSSRFVSEKNWTAP